jgi:hypothetical protein
MVNMASPEAEAALWESHVNVAAFVMRFYEYLKPQVANILSQAASKIHLSFDGWTVKGGKRGFFSVAAHFVDAAGKLRDLPIALSQLLGPHTCE